MKRLILAGIFFSVSLLAFSSSGFCADSQNIQVSITIPEIPGVNAPPLISETKVTSAKNQAYSSQDVRQNTKPQPLPMIQEDTQKKDQNEKDADLTMLVKTLYPR